MIRMPKALHRKLKRQAKKKGYTGKRADRYVYGTMGKIEKRKKAKRKRSSSRRKK